MASNTSPVLCAYNSSSVFRRERGDKPARPAKISCRDALRGGFVSPVAMNGGAVESLGASVLALKDGRSVAACEASIVPRNDDSISANDFRLTVEAAPVVEATEAGREATL